jgi:cysteine desulfurase/selenocysteine lyase
MRLGFERELLAHGTRVLNQIPGLRLIGTAADKAGVLSFVLTDIHPHDIGTILDGEGIAVRTGHHCAQPLMRRFGVDATVRASLAFYNTPQELDRLGVALQKVKEIFE